MTVWDGGHYYRQEVSVYEASYRLGTEGLKTKRRKNHGRRKKKRKTIQTKAREEDVKKEIEGKRPEEEGEARGVLRECVVNLGAAALTQLPVWELSDGSSNSTLMMVSGWLREGQEPLCSRTLQVFEAGRGACERLRQEVCCSVCGSGVGGQSCRRIGKDRASPPWEGIG